MKFSEYTIIAKPEQSVDPLGFTQPFGNLRSRLFPQFTVLSNSPVYHGILTLIYQVLAKKKVTPSQTGFARFFREAECLWGLANVAAGQSVLNVTKYQAILEGRTSLTLAEIGRNNAIFRSLAYGTLGHYSSPSVTWSFLERGAQRLTPLGDRLGDAFSTRNKQSLSSALEEWLNGQSIRISKLEALGKTFGIENPPSRTEQRVWQDAVQIWRDRTPETRGLWTDPLDEAELQALRKDAATYKDFFDHLSDRYPRLKKLFEQLSRFETMSAICQFLFQREYLLCHDASKKLPKSGPLEKNLSTMLIKIAQYYTINNIFFDTKSLFYSLSKALDYKIIPYIIIRHHIEHQKSKNTLPYMEENGEMIVRERFDRQQFTTLHEELSHLKTTEAQLALLTYEYRRDWHFDRALRYNRYLRGKV